MTVCDDLLETIIRERVQVLMMDFLLNDKDKSLTGLTVIADLRAKGIAIPVILFSGAAHLIDHAQAAKLGVVRILDKPLSIQELRVSLNEARRVFMEQTKVS